MNMYEKREKLKELLHEKTCTPVMGAYDMLSAKVIENVGFPVVYTGSFVTGTSAFCLPDTGLVQLKDLLDLSREIAKEVDLPIFCDADTGWYHAANIWRVVHEFESAGTSGIHIEDTRLGKHTKFKPVFASRDAMCANVKACCDARKDKNFLIVPRTDVYLQTQDVDDAVDRANAYLEAGADAVFVTFRGDIQKLADFRPRIQGPVMTTSGAFQYSLAEETAAGLDMSIYWPITLYAAYKSVKKACEMFWETKDMSKLTEFKYSETELIELLGYDRYAERMEKYQVFEKFFK